MESSGSASLKRKRSSSDDVNQENILAKRTRGVPPSPRNPASPNPWLDARLLVREAANNGMDLAVLMKETCLCMRESSQNPSELAVHSGCYPHQEGEDPKYLCHRPQHAVPPVPVILLFEPLSQFADNVKAIPISDEDLSFAQKFWDDVHSKEYVIDHGNKVANMVNGLQRYCPDGLVVPSYRVTDRSVLDGAGLDKLSNAFCMWLEYKAELGKSGDPYFQVLDYVLRCDGEDRNHALQTYGIAVCVSGPHLQVLAVTVVDEKVWADPLGFVQCYGGLEALEATARVWAAVRQFFRDYKPVVGKYTAGEAVPWPLKGHRDLLRIDEKRLVYTYRNEQGRPELAKFVQSYCEEAHAAWIPHAPELRGIRAIVGDWRLVRMEYLSGWRSVAEILKGAEDSNRIAKIESCIVEVVNRGHAQGFVHGDVRLPNILVREGAENEADDSPAYEVKLLDFDWSGKSGRARYPRRLSKAIEWPAGATYGALISEEHDIWFARHLMQQLK